MHCDCLVTFCYWERLAHHVGQAKELAHVYLREWEWHIFLGGTQHLRLPSPNFVSTQNIVCRNRNMAVSEMLSAFETSNSLSMSCPQRLLFNDSRAYSCYTRHIFRNYPFYSIFPKSSVPCLFPLCSPLHLWELEFLSSSFRELDHHVLIKLLSPEKAAYYVFGFISCLHPLAQS